MTKHRKYSARNGEYTATVRETAGLVVSAARSEECGRSIKSERWKCFARPHCKQSVTNCVQRTIVQPDVLCSYNSSFLLPTLILTVLLLVLHHPSLLHSTLKTLLFCKSFLAFLSSSGLITRIPHTFTVTSDNIRYYFSVFVSVLHFLVVGSVQ